MTAVGGLSFFGAVHVAVGPDPPVQALHEVKPLFSDVHLCHTSPNGQHELKKTKVRLEGLQQNPTALCHMRSRLQYRHAKQCIPLNRCAGTNTHRKISLNTRCMDFIFGSFRWAARYITELLINLTPKGVVFSFSFLFFGSFL